MIKSLGFICTVKYNDHHIDSMLLTDCEISELLEGDEDVVSIKKCWKLLYDTEYDATLHVKCNSSM